MVMITTTVMIVEITMILILIIIIMVLRTITMVRAVNGITNDNEGDVNFANGNNIHGNKK